MPKVMVELVEAAAVDAAQLAAQEAGAVTLTVTVTLTVSQ